jgi:hypothetical protein
MAYKSFLLIGQYDDKGGFLACKTRQSKAGNDGNDDDARQCEQGMMIAM